MLVEAGPLAGVETASVDVDDLSVVAVEQALAHADPLVRQHAADCCLQVAGADAAAARPFVPALLGALDDESVVVVQRSAAALIPIAENHPADFADAGPALVDLLAAEPSTVQVYGAKLLAAIVVDEPQIVALVVDRLARSLAEGDVPGPADLPQGTDVEAAQTIQRHQAEDRERVRLVRETVANVVTAVAEVDPEAVLPAVDDLVACLDDPVPGVIAAVLDALGWVAEPNPAAVRPHRSRLVACLDHDDRVVRARAIRALGLLGDPETVTDLESLADSDPDEDVAALAAETASWLRAA